MNEEQIKKKQKKIQNFNVSFRGGSHDSWWYYAVTLIREKKRVRRFTEITGITEITEITTEITTEFTKVWLNGEYYTTIYYFKLYFNICLHDFCNKKKINILLLLIRILNSPTITVDTGNFRL